MPSADPTHKPFVLTLQRLAETPDGSFRPGALVQISPALRTSGLLLSLPGEDLKNLLLVLTFAHPNGHVQPSLLELAHALRQPQPLTRSHLRRLERFVWQGSPLLYELKRESGLDAYAPSPHILDIQHEPANWQAQPPAPAYRAARREAVIAHSRAAYARPREEVEQEIAALNGWPWPSKSLAETLDTLRQEGLSPANAPPMRSSAGPIPISSVTVPPMSNTPHKEQTPDLQMYLLALGVPQDQARDLLTRFDTARIRRQIEWLPWRKANHPARLLVAAIEGDYEAPAALRHSQDAGASTPPSFVPEGDSPASVSPSPESVTDLPVP